MASDAVIPVRDFSSPECDPPRVRWWALFIIGGILNFLSQLYVPQTFHSLGITLFYNGWAIYVCLWMRRTNPASTSIVWTGAALFLNLTGEGLELIAQSAPAIDAPIWMAICAFSLIIAAILQVIGAFKLRSEMQWHYSVVENRGLVLGPVMTLFFSYLYFQYHLADIAEQRASERNSYRGSITT